MNSGSQIPIACLITAFGTVVFIDETGTLRHGPVEHSFSNTGLTALLERDGMTGRYQIVRDRDGARGAVACNADRCELAAVGTAFELVTLERGLFALKSGPRYLSAHPDGTVCLAAERCSTWEMFLASEDWCSSPPDGAPRDLTGPDFDTKRIQSYIIHPSIRVRANTHAPKAKILVYGYPGWSHGRVYYDLCKHLHRHGYIVDILNWQENHASYFESLRSYYDWFITALDGVNTLVDAYRVPYEQIIAVSHHEFDIRMLIEQKGTEVFDKFANYAVVSEFLYCASLMRGVARAPMVASLGIDYANFFSPVSDGLRVVGYASSMSAKTYGVEWKRGALVEAAAASAGLSFKIAGSTANQISFHDMPEFYRTVDAVAISSISESGPLTVMEAAAAGRLVIGTPVGHFPEKAYEGAGIMAPVEASKFVSFTAETLKYYSENSTAYVEKCRAIQDAAKRSDWRYHIQDWLDVIGHAGST